MWPDPQESADSVTFTEEILNGESIFCALQWHKDLFINKANNEM